MKQMDAMFLQIITTGMLKLFVKTVYVFEVDGKVVRFDFNRFLAGHTPIMRTKGILTVDDNHQFVSFDYEGGYLALKKRKHPHVEIPRR